MKIYKILWIVFFGWIEYLLLIFAGILSAITIVLLPLTPVCFKLAKLSFNPFDKDVYTDYDSHRDLNFLWRIICGWGYALESIFGGILLCLTIIFIPFGIQQFKFAKLLWTPYGAEID